PRGAGDPRRRPGPGRLGRGQPGGCRTRPAPPRAAPSARSLDVPRHVARRDRRANRHAARDREGSRAAWTFIDPSCLAGRTRGVAAVKPAADPRALELLAERAIRPLD